MCIRVVGAIAFAAKGGWTVSAIALSTASSRWTSRPRSRYKGGEPKEFAAMAEFPRKTPADWRAQAAKDLKGRSPDDLTWETPEGIAVRSEEHTSELQSLMRISYAVFCLKKKKQTKD